MADNKRLINSNIFGIRVTKEQKAELQALLEQAELRVNKRWKKGISYKVRRNDIAFYVLKKFVPKVMAEDF